MGTPQAAPRACHLHRCHMLLLDLEPCAPLSPICLPQFLLFYVCRQSPDHCCRAFLHLLISRLTDKQQPPIARAACAAYAASFLARQASQPASQPTCLPASQQDAITADAAWDTPLHKKPSASRPANSRPTAPVLLFNCNRPTQACPSAGCVQGCLLPRGPGGGEPAAHRRLVPALCPG